MKSYFIEVNNLRLYCEEQNPDAFCSIFFFHGNSSSLRTWRNQFKSDLAKAYRLVAIDLPAHGKSSASGKPEEDYSLPGLALLMKKAVELLHNNKPYLLAAVSLATNIVAEMLAYTPFPLGVVLAGPCITGDKYTLDVMIRKGVDANAIFTDKVPEEAVKKYALETSASRKSEDLVLFLNDYYRVATPFRSSLFTTVVSTRYNDQVELLKNAHIPILCVFGAQDGIIDPSYLDSASLQWWGNQIYKINGASHLVHLDQPDTFNELLQSFAEEVFKSPHS